MTVETGTTASDTQPQKVSGATEGGKLIAGKFKTMEEAVEQGYMGLERKVTENNEKLSAVLKVLETAMAAPDPARANTVDVGQSGSDDNSSQYGRGTDFKVDPAEFLANPGKVIKQVEDRAYGRAMKSTAELVANAMVVSEFRGRNSDLKPHEKLVGSFMADTDGRKPLNERLEEAAKLTRTYLGKLKAEWTGDARHASGNEVVEEPGGARIAAAGDETEKDQTLAEYVRERHMEKASHFGPPARK